MTIKIGVLALQGDFAEHVVMLRRVGVETCEVRAPGDLVGVDGLVVPGGESTTIGKLLVRFGLLVFTTVYVRLIRILSTFQPGSQMGM